LTIIVVNLVAKFYAVAKIPQIYCWGILIWATLYILLVKWQDRVPYTSLLERCNIESIEAIIIRSQLRRCGHVTRMPDDHIPKQLFYGQLPDRAGSQEVS